MKKCIWCKKHKAFKSYNRDGICPECLEEYEKEMGIKHNDSNAGKPE